MRKRADVLERGLLIGGKSVPASSGKVADVFRAFMNDQGIGDEPMAPFGGVKNSGYGKFGGTAGIESFTEQRWVTIQHSGRPTYPF
jgi:acyl-CoA reductase-like NAD-dependent aldehyde dehydrogenase